MILQFLAGGLLLLSLGYLMLKPKIGILCIFFSMPLIATTWNLRFGGSSMIQLSYGAMVPLMFFIWKPLPKQIPSAWVMCALLIVLGGFYGFFWNAFYLPFDIMSYLEYVFIGLNLWLGFFMLPMYFSKYKDFRQLLIVLICSGFFPTAVAFYQALTGIVWQERMIMGIVRYDGLYHDSVVCRMFIFTALFAVLFSLLGGYFYHRLMRFLLVVYGVMMIVALYNLSSRAVFGIIVLWLGGLTIFYKKWFYGILLIACVVAINAWFDNFLFDRVEFLFSKEMAIHDGEMDQMYFLSGRGMLWQDHMQQFLSWGPLAIIFGTGWQTPAHNEFMRVLFISGIIGVVLFSFGLLFVLSFCLKKLWTRTLPGVSAFLLLISFFVDCIGITPGVYPSYNWFLWGMIGILLFSGDQCLPPNYKCSPIPKNTEKNYE